MRSLITSMSSWILLFSVLLFSLGWLPSVNTAPLLHRIDSILQVETREKYSRRPVPARIYLTDSSGKAWEPAGAIVYNKGGERHFIADKPFSISLQPGEYTLRVERGTEYSPSTRTFRMEPGKNRKESVALGRWIDMNRLGWFSGDLHNHRRVEDMPALLLAEDLNLAPTITDWIWEDRPVASPPITTDAILRV